MEFLHLAITAPGNGVTFSTITVVVVEGPVSSSELGVVVGMGNASVDVGSTAATVDVLGVGLTTISGGI